MRSAPLFVTRRFPAIVALALGAAAALAGPPAFADGNVNVVAGPRYLDDGSWSPIDHQTAYGVQVDFGRHLAPVNFSLGYHRGTAENHSIEPPPVGDLRLQGEISEASAGITRAWEVSRLVRPFFGGGLSYVSASSKAEIQGVGSTHDSSSGVGLWLDFGVYWRLAQRLNLGLDARILKGAKVNLFGFDRDADYRQIGILIGWGWPGSR